MKRWAFLFLLGCLLATSAAWADDFLDFFDNLMTKQVSEENLRQVLAPFELNAEIYTTRTADGWNLVAHRYLARSPALAGAEPVILCHGLGYSALFWDLDPTCSFATYLAERGYDVWSVSLRGCGLSQKWLWKLETAPTTILGSGLRQLTRGKLAPTGYASLDTKYANWTMDDHIAYDVPAFVALVRQHTGSKRVTWVGHSMGGIIALGHIERYGNPGIGKLVAVGSQVTMPEGQLFLQFLIEATQCRELQLHGKLTTNQAFQAGKSTFDNLFFNQEHASPAACKALCSWANDIPSFGLLKQYRVMARTGELLDAKGNYNYAKHLAKVRLPVLIACGQADQLAPPAVQKYLYDQVGSLDKKLIVFGEARGFAVNAGHNDVFVGRTSREQVYPVIQRWIRAGRER